MPVRVIGVGTPRGDDAAGLMLARRLAQRAGERPGLEVLGCEQPLDLVDLLEGAHRFVLVDASRSGAPPGTTRALCAEQLARGARWSSHALGVAEALALKSALGGLPAELEIYGIEADPHASPSADPSGETDGESLSPAVRLAVERLSATLWERFSADPEAAASRSA